MMRVRPRTLCDDLTFIADSSMVSRLAPPQIVEYLMNDEVRIISKIVIERSNTFLSLTGGLAAFH